MRKKIFSFLMIGMLISNLTMPVMAAGSDETEPQNLESEEPIQDVTEEPTQDVTEEPTQDVTEEQAQDQIEDQSQDKVSEQTNVENVIVEEDATVTTDEANAVSAVEPSNTNIITDLNLQKAINESLRLDPEHVVTQNDLLGLRVLSASERGIKSLEGLQYATNLSRADLRNNEITEIEILDNLPSLLSVDITGNPQAEGKVLQKYFEITSELIVGMNYSELDFWKRNKFETAYSFKVEIEPSDPTMMDISKDERGYTHVNVLKEGTVTLTAKCGTAEKTFSVNCVRMDSEFIKDMNLYKQINENLGYPITHKLTKRDLENVTYLEVTGQEVKSLEGLQYAVNLDQLSLAHLGAINIDVLDRLPNLSQVGIVYSPELEVMAFRKNYIIPTTMMAGSSFYVYQFKENYRYDMLADVEFVSSDPSVLEIDYERGHEFSITKFNILKEGKVTLKITSGNYEETVDITCTPNSSSCIKDANLLSRINKKLGFEYTHNVTKEELLNLEELDVESAGICNLEGLQYASNLKTLNLCSNNVEDITVLENMPNLKKVNITGNTKAEEQVVSKYFKKKFEPIILGTQAYFQSMDSLIESSKYTSLSWRRDIKVELESNGVFEAQGLPYLESNFILYGKKLGKEKVTFTYGNVKKTVEIECVDGVSKIDPADKVEVNNNILPCKFGTESSVFAQDGDVYCNDQKNTKKLITGKNIVQIFVMNTRINNDENYYFVLAKDSNNSIWAMKLYGTTPKGELVKVADNVKAMYSRGYMDQEGIVHVWQRYYDSTIETLQEEIQLSNVVAVMEENRDGTYSAVAGVYFDGGSKRLIWDDKIRQSSLIENRQESNIILVKELYNFAMDQNGKLYTRDDNFKFTPMIPELVVDDIAESGYLKDGTFYSWDHNIISENVLFLNGSMQNTGYITKDHEYYELKDNSQWVLRCKNVKKVSKLQDYILDNQGTLYQVVKKIDNTKYPAQETSYELFPVMYSVKDIQQEDASEYAQASYKVWGLTALREDGSIWKIYGDTYPECIFTPGHIHEPELVKGTPATEDKPGTKSYYKCSCGKYFEDEECTIEITEDIDKWKVIPVIKGSWKQSGSKWWYAYETGGYPANRFKEIDGQTYYFDEYGYMVTGWRMIEGKYYYFSESGYMQKGEWQWIDGNCYYFYEDGHMASNETIEGNYVNGSGVWTTDHWEYSNGKYWYAYAKGGYPFSTFKKINGQTYYFDDHGYMVTGWRMIEGKYYYFNESGYMQKDEWKWINGYRYYFYPDGHMASNETIGDDYVNSSGVWVTDRWVYSDYAGKYWYSYAKGGYPYSTFKTIGDQTYYFDGSGYMVTGWNWIEGKYYYFNGSGYMQKGGWQWINGSCYYFYEDGHMAANETVDGAYVNSSGAWTTDHWVYSNYAGKYWYSYAKGGYPYNRFKTIGGQTYYFDGSGYMVTGWRWIEDNYYYFNGSGYMQKGGWQWINGSCYYFYEDGHMAANETVDGAYVDGSGAWVR